MLPTFVIGLREGLEASLIVGIVAAFLRQRGSGRDLRWVWLGVGAAVALCVAVAATLQAVDSRLPERQQDGLETVIALVAVAVVTSMIVWMARNARSLKGDLERRAGAALAQGSVAALVVMAFLAVLREGFETAVFLLSALQASAADRSTAGLGAVLGIMVAVGVGVAIYKGGVRINLARFFAGTGLVLVLVAAGLLVFAVHTGHEAGWIGVGQSRLVDLTGVVAPGSIRSALITGVLGIQPRPTVIEAVAWVAYLVPAALFVLVTAGRPRRSTPLPAT